MTAKAGVAATASNVLLVSGYSAATWGGMRIFGALKGHEPRRYVAFQAGTACVVAGLALRRRWIPAGLNAGALAGAGLLRLVLGRRAGRRAGR